MPTLPPTTTAVKDLAAIGTITSLSIADIQVSTRTRKQHGDLDALAASIAEVGLLHPVVVNSDNVLIAGERRLRAAKQLGWTEIPARVVKDLDDALLALKAERDENTCRLDFAPSEAVKVGARLEKLQPKPGRPKAGESPALSKKGDTRDKVGAAVGMGGSKYEAAKKVMAAAKADPALAPVVEEMDRTGNVSRALRAVRQERETDLSPPSALRPIGEDQQLRLIQRSAELCLVIGPNKAGVALPGWWETYQRGQPYQADMSQAAMLEKAAKELEKQAADARTRAADQKELAKEHGRQAFIAEHGLPIHYAETLNVDLSAEMRAELPTQERAAASWLLDKINRGEVKVTGSGCWGDMSLPFQIVPKAIAGSWSSIGSADWLTNLLSGKVAPEQPEPEDEPRVQTFDEEVAAIGGAA
jgi:ParB family chromosome partitioning protein